MTSTLVNIISRWSTRKNCTLEGARRDGQSGAGAGKKYLQVFMSDQEAWMELCELYTLEQEYSKVSLL